MYMKWVIGVDMGTTNIKVIAGDDRGRVVFRNEAPCDTLQTLPERSEQDPEVVLQVVNNLLKEAFAHIPASRIAAVSFSAAMHSLIALDEKGDHLTNAILWGDSRSYYEERELKEAGIAEKLYRETGVPLHPSLPLCKIVWLRKHQPQVFQRTAKFVSLKEYVFYKLFGVYVVDHAIAGATGMLNIHTLHWSSLALATAGIGAHQLSAIVPATHMETTVPEASRHLLGLSQNIPFVVGASDGCLANIGTGVTDNTKAALTIGTSGAVRTTLHAPRINDAPTLFCYVLTPDIYIKGGAVNNGAFVLQWLIKDLLKLPLSEEVYTMLLSEAAATPAGAEGLIFLPYLKGERAPVWNARAKGVFFGLNSLHGRAHLVRAVMEGVGYALYDVFGEMTAGGDQIQEIYVSGGFIKSTLWVQMIADIFNKTVVVTDAADASALGAVYLGWLATGVYETMAGLPLPDEGNLLYHPHSEYSLVYRKRFSKYRSLYRALENEFE